MQSFSYIRPRTLQEALRAIGETESARVLAGGTTLYDLMKLDVETPRRLIDLTALPGLDTIVAGENGLELGALARMADVAADREVTRVYPALAESLTKAASQQLRNMATVGGNLLQRTRCPYFRGGEPFACNKRSPGSGCSAIGGIDRTLALLGTSESCVANYPGDWAVALTAFDAEIEISGARGVRRLKVEELYREPGTTPHVETVLQRGELITRIFVPRAAATRASTYHKVRDRESYAFALASAAVGVDVSGGLIRDARIALGGVATRPWRVRAAEEILKGKPYGVELARAAAESAFANARPGRENGFRIPLGIETVVDAIAIAVRRS